MQALVLLSLAASISSAYHCHTGQVTLLPQPPIISLPPTGYPLSDIQVFDHLTMVSSRSLCTPYDYKQWELFVLEPGSSNYTEIPYNSDDHGLLEFTNSVQPTFGVKTDAYTSISLKLTGRLKQESFDLNFTVVKLEPCFDFKDDEIVLEYKQFTPVHFDIDTLFMNHITVTKPDVCTDFEFKIYCFASTVFTSRCQDMRPEEFASFFKSNAQATKATLEVTSARSSPARLQIQNDELTVGTNEQYNSSFILEVTGTDNISLRTALHFHVVLNCSSFQLNTTLSHYYPTMRLASSQAYHYLVIIQVEFEDQSLDTTYPTIEMSAMEVNETLGLLVPASNGYLQQINGTNSYKLVVNYNGTVPETFIQARFSTENCPENTVTHNFTYETCSSFSIFEYLGSDPINTTLLMQSESIQNLVLPGVTLHNYNFTGNHTYCQKILRPQFYLNNPCEDSSETSLTNQVVWDNSYLYLDYNPESFNIIGRSTVKQYYIKATSYSNRVICIKLNLELDCSNTISVLYNEDGNKATGEYKIYPREDVTGFWNFKFTTSRTIEGCRETYTLYNDSEATTLHLGTENKTVIWTTEPSPGPDLFNLGFNKSQPHLFNGSLVMEAGGRIQQRVNIQLMICGFEEIIVKQSEVTIRTTVLEAATHTITMDQIKEQWIKHVVPDFYVDPFQTACRVNIQSICSSIECTSTSKVNFTIRPNQQALYLSRNQASKQVDTFYMRLSTSGKVEGIIKVNYFVCGSQTMGFKDPMAKVIQAHLVKGARNFDHPSQRPSYLVKSEEAIKAMIEIEFIEYCEITGIWIEDKKHESIVYENGTGLLVHTDVVLLRAEVNLTLSTISNSSIQIPFNLTMCGAEVISMDLPEETHLILYDQDKTPSEIPRTVYEAYFNSSNPEMCPIQSVQLVIKIGEEYSTSVRTEHVKVHSVTNAIVLEPKRLTTNVTYPDYYFEARTETQVAYKHFIIKFERGYELPELYVPEVFEKVEQQPEEEEPSNNQTSNSTKPEEVVVPEPITVVPQNESIEEEEAVSEPDTETDEEEPAVASIGSTVPHWMKFMSQSEINKANQLHNNERLRAQQAFLLTQKEPLPIKLRIDYISRNGNLQINFNQKLIVPKFIRDIQEKASARQLQESIGEINVEQEILKLSFKLYSDVNPKQIEYFIQLQAWDQDHILLSLNFTNPQLISQGRFEDLVSIKIKNRDYFSSLESGVVLENRNAMIKFKKQIPAQLPKGVREEDLISQSKQATQSITLFFLFQIAIQLVLKQSVDHLKYLFFQLQLIAWTSLFEIQQPANIEIYMHEIKKLVNFELLKPDAILKTVGIDETLQELLTGQLQIIQNKNLYNSGIQSENSFMNLLPYIVIVVLIIFLALAIKTASFIFKRYRERIIQFLQEQKKDIFWNDVIKSITISFLPQCMALSGAVLLSVESGQMGKFNLASNSLQTIFLLAFAIGLGVFPIAISDEVRSSPEHLRKFEILYHDIKPQEGKLSLFYYSVFLLRRFAFSLIPLVFAGNEGFQIIALFLLNEFYIMYIVHNVTFKQRILTKLISLNEVCFIVLCYFLLIFSHFSKFQSEEYVNQTFYLGYVYLSMIGLLVVFNLSYIAYQTLSYLAWVKLMKKKVRQRNEKFIDQKAKGMLIRWKVKKGYLKLKPKEEPEAVPDSPEALEQSCQLREFQIPIKGEPSPSRSIESSNGPFSPAKKDNLSVVIEQSEHSEAPQEELDHNPNVLTVEQILSERFDYLEDSDDSSVELPPIIKPPKNATFN